MQMSLAHPLPSLIALEQLAASISYGTDIFSLFHQKEKKRKLENRRPFLVTQRSPDQPEMPPSEPHPRPLSPWLSLGRMVLSRANGVGEWV
jgi:hypothetical protein